MVIKYRVIAVLVLIIGLAIGFFVYDSEQEEPSWFSRPFSLGLDLAGGSHLVYEADVSEIPEQDVSDAMQALREVIERRVDAFGVAEPVVQIERGGVFGAGEHRLIIELPGVTDLEEAIRMIGETPELEFKLMQDDFEFSVDDFDIDILDDGESEVEASEEEGVEEDEVSLDAPDSDDMFIVTGLTGRFIQGARLSFDQTNRQPYVSLDFNREGRDLFAEITTENVGERLAILLDGEVISSPVIREPIRDGRAMISGGFMDAAEARELVRNINLGALPVPIELVSTQTVGATLGQDVVEKGVFAGIIGLSLVALFLLFWYRLPGLLAVISLSIYVVAMLALFKLIPVTLTAAGIAGFILSIGMAVDANILIFERMKEELRKGNSLGDSINEGFARAWLAIRDGNISSIITAIVLFYFGTAMVQGFALTFGIGVLISMVTAISVTRTFLLAVGLSEKPGGVLFGTGIK